MRAVFVPLARLQQELEVGRRVNTLLVSASRGRRRRCRDALAAARRRRDADARGLGLTLRRSTATARARRRLGRRAARRRQRTASGASSRPWRSRRGIAASRSSPISPTRMRVGDREIPYSLVTALDRSAADRARTAPRRSDASDAERPDRPERLGRPRPAGAPGDRADAGVLRLGGPGPARHAHGRRSASPASCRSTPAIAIWRPTYPRHQRLADARATGTRRFRSTSRRIRPVDEQYWERVSHHAEGVHPARGRPAAVALALRRADVDSRRRPPMADRSRRRASASQARLRAAIDPLALGLAVRDVRADGLAASRGATDFGEYFVYFSFFLVVSALLLASLFFKLGVEQRVREVGPAARRRLRPGRRPAAVPAAKGCCSRSPAARSAWPARVGYAWLLMLGLRTWWVDAVGTTALTLHVSPASLAGGRRRRRASPRSSASGGRCGPRRASPSGACSPATSPRRRCRSTGGATRATLGCWPRRSSLLAACGLLASRRGAGAIDPAGAFFGAGAALLAASPLRCSRWRSGAGRAARSPAAAGGRCRGSACATRPIARAAACFDGRDRVGDVHPDLGRRVPPRRRASRPPIAHSGIGGYALHRRDAAADRPRSRTRATGARRSNLSDLDDVGESSRSGCCPGDDASCLNLYEPTNPRILRRGTLPRAQGGSRSSGSLATTDAERANPWLLLQRDGAGRRGPGDRRRQLDDLRAAPRARRRHRHRRAAAGRSGCVSWRRCATASSRASC